MKKLNLLIVGLSLLLTLTLNAKTGFIVQNGVVKLNTLDQSNHQKPTEPNEPLKPLEPIRYAKGRVKIIKHVFSSDPDSPYSGAIEVCKQEIPKIPVYDTRITENHKVFIWTDGVNCTDIKDQASVSVSAAINIAKTNVLDNKEETKDIFSYIFGRPLEGVAQTKSLAKMPDGQVLVGSRDLNWKNMIVSFQPNLNQKCSNGKCTVYVGSYYSATLDIED